LKTGYDEQLRRKPEQWAQYHTQKTPLVSSTLPMATPSPTPPSPLFSVDFSTEVGSQRISSFSLAVSVTCHLIFLVKIFYLPSVVHKINSIFYQRKSNT